MTIHCKLRQAKGGGASSFSDFGGSVAACAGFVPRKMRFLKMKRAGFWDCLRKSRRIHNEIELSE